MIKSTADLAMEAHELASKNKSHLLDGVIFEKEMLDDATLVRIEIKNKEGEEATGKPVGTYLTLEMERVWEGDGARLKRYATILSELIGEVIDKKRIKKSCVLVVGLGNISMISDAIGPRSLEYVITTRHIKTSSPEIYSALGFAEVSTLSPGVLGKTGIETQEIVKSVSGAISPSLIIAIDSLATRDVSRLGCAVQITDTGIAPGSGLGIRNSRISSDTVGIPVISVGVPTVVNALTLVENVLSRKDIDTDFLKECHALPEAELFVAPKDSDVICEEMARLVGYSVNMALHTALSYEDMKHIAN